MLYCIPIKNPNHHLVGNYIDEILEIFHSLIDIKTDEWLVPLDCYIAAKSPSVSLSFMVIATICSGKEFNFINDTIRKMVKTPIAFRDYCDQFGETTSEEIRKHILDETLRDKIFSATVNLFDKE